MKTKWKEEELKEFEEELAKAFEAGKINCPLHLSGGNEGDLIHIFDGIQEKDYVISTHRNHYHYLLKGGDEKKLLDEIYGKKSGVCGGNARSMNVIDPSINFYASAIVAGGCAIAVGIALGLKKRETGKKKNKAHVWCFVGDAVLDGGHFWEALQYAQGYDLPITFIIEDNDRSTCTSLKDRLGPYRYQLRNSIIGSNKVIYYQYTAKYPHVGSGKYIAF